MESINTRKNKIKKDDEKNNEKKERKSEKAEKETQMNGKLVEEQNHPHSCKPKKLFEIQFSIDLISISLFFTAIITRMHKLQEPKNIV